MARARAEESLPLHRMEPRWREPDSYRDRRCALNTRPAPADNQEDVRCTRRHPGGDHPAGERVDYSEEPPGNPLAQVRPGARWTITCHRLPLPSALAAPQGSSCSAYVGWLDRAATDGR